MEKKIKMEKNLVYDLAAKHLPLVAIFYNLVPKWQLQNLFSFES